MLHFGLPCAQLSLQEMPCVETDPLRITDSIIPSSDTLACSWWTTCKELFHPLPPVLLRQDSNGRTQSLYDQYLVYTSAVTGMDSYARVALLH